MALVDSLLSAIVRASGDALVMHVGEKPYVVAAGGQVELASRPLTLQAMTGMLVQLLPPESQEALEEIGAVQHDIVSPVAADNERFAVVAARGGDDIWIEIRRYQVKAEPEAPAGAAHPETVEEPDHAGPPVPSVPAAAPEPAPVTGPAEDRQVRLRAIEEAEEALPPPRPLIVEREFLPAPIVPVPAPAEREAGPAVVLPLSRPQVRGEQPARVTTPSRLAGIDRLLRIAAARGASALYLVSHARPSIRVDGEISQVEGEASLSESDVEALLLDIMPERNREALRSSAGTEWICDVPEVGRVRCLSFRDHRGAGGIFRMIPARAISAEQLGLSRAIQNLSSEPEGLVLVAGLRSSGRSTLISAFVDLINRTRSAHVITLESQVKFVHENRNSLVSQREVRGDSDELLLAVRSALRENPDVLVVEDLQSSEIASAAVEAAQSGHLVIGALTAHTTTAAIDRILDQTARERRPKVQLALAEALRGVVAQVLLRKTGGGRVAAREVLLNTSAVSTLIAEGKTSQLPMAIESGRKYGMVPLNDALAGFVQSGAVDSREAYRMALDRQGFLGLLKREGIDTSFAERLA